MELASLSKLIQFKQEGSDESQHEVEVAKIEKIPFKRINYETDKDGTIFE